MQLDTICKGYDGRKLFLVTIYYIEDTKNYHFIFILRVDSSFITIMS